MSPGLKMDPPGLHHLEEPITHKNDKSTGGGSVKGTKSSCLLPRSCLPCTLPALASPATRDGRPPTPESIRAQTAKERAR